MLENHMVIDTDTLITQEFTTKANCEAAGAFIMASHEELYQANLARYTCLPK